MRPPVAAAASARERIRYARLLPVAPAAVLEAAMDTRIRII
jgi:hypothetical protein